MLYRKLLRPLLFRLDAERAHEWGLRGLRWGLGTPLTRFPVRAVTGVRDAALEQTLWGLRFANPVGLAAGLDKNAQVIEPLAALGFGHVEVGTLTGEAQPGNPRPRLFRLVDDAAVINRMGFNNVGSAAAAARLGARYVPRGERGRRPRCVLGINIGKTKVVPNEFALDDYRASVERLGALADYLVVNVSSPNTPGLRDLQAEASLRPLLEGVRAALDEHAPGTPLLLKIAPDLADAGIDAAVDVALGCGCDGLIATNTTISRTGLHVDRATLDAIGGGGLSGRPLAERSTAVVARVARRLDGRLPVIGVGGVGSVEEAWRKITHGASLVQVYTAFIYQGPGLARALNRGLLERLRSHGLSKIGEAVGRDL